MQMSIPRVKANVAGVPDKPWYRHRWPWLLMLGPATVIVAGAFTIWLAFSHQDALVVDDYYKQGKAINQDLRRDALAARNNMQLELNYDAAQGKLNGRLVSTVDMASQNIRLLLIHPTLPQSDMNFVASTDRVGHFQITLPLLQIGHWQVQVEDQERNWRLSGNWAWPQQKQIQIKADAPAAE